MMKKIDPLVRNQLIGGICAGLVVVLALIRIFVLHASVDGTLMNLMSILNAILSLVVLASAVIIILKVMDSRSFDAALKAKLDEIDERYGALIIRSPSAEKNGALVYVIAANTDAIFVNDPNDLPSEYMEKFAFSPSFRESKHIYFYLNHANMKARSLIHGQTPEVTARLLARDIAIVIQRAFADILAVHAIETSSESGRAVVTITVKNAETAKDAARIGQLIDYLLFLHFVAV